ncbi:uncharacterized protein [Aristolochia californica]|uniref:uncharacterized protein n=1 Tax=Aristolochia californica TaxID=171875 RepID=UPI0035D80756
MVGVRLCLWCGHTICKNCTLALQWASIKFQAYPIQLPLFISCPWCQTLSFRLAWKGNLSFPHRNYFLQWLVESMNVNQMRSNSSAYGNQGISPLGNLQCPQSDILLLSQQLRGHSPHQLINNEEGWRIRILLLVTFFFAFPSFLVLNFSYPILDWLLREIAA